MYQRAWPSFAPMAAERSVKGRGNEQDVSIAFVLQGWLPNEH